MRTPGCTPWMMRADIITAVTGSPGMPRASVGTSAPPVTALLAASEATMPSGSPVPSLSR